jgi:hypothetical protein
MQTENDIIQIWKENNIEKCVMEFSCGGDSMGDTEFTLYDNEGNQVSNDDITEYFDHEIYDYVDFYEVSDGHYMGESGTVTIELEEYDGESSFTFSKDAQSEFEETFSGIMEFNLTEVEVKLLEEKISNFNKSEWDSQVFINYKDDCVITDEEEVILNDLIKRIEDESFDFEIEDATGEEVGSERSFDTGEDGEGLNIGDSVLQVRISSRFYYTQDAD